MKVYIYTMIYDNGFAPNPFHGTLTLANCKPKIRKACSPGDIIVGLGGVRLGKNKLVYICRVSECVTRAEYWSRFPQKRPSPIVLPTKLMFLDCPYPRHEQVGDNCYELIHDTFHQHLCIHTFARHAAVEQGRDLSVDRVILSDTFMYFGGYGPTWPYIRPMGRSHIILSADYQVDDVLKYMNHLRGKYGTGLINNPTTWPTEKPMQPMRHNQPQPSDLF